MNLYQNKNLLAAFDLYVRRQDALLPTEEELSSVTLSSEFQAKMERLLTLRKRGYYVWFGTVERQVASVLLALLLALTTATVSVKAWREKVAEFFAQVFDTHTAVTFVDETPNLARSVTFEHKAPTYIPDGYVVEKETSSQGVYNIIFVDKDDNAIRYKQRQKDKIGIQADTEESAYIKTTINNLVGITYNNKGVITVLFSDDKYTFTLSGPCTLEELIKVAESIQ